MMTLDSIAVKPQPAPTGNGTDVTALVLQDLRDRREAGTRKYGTPLQTNNGRDAIVDAYQELLDLTVYLRQEIEQRGQADTLVRCPVCKSAIIENKESHARCVSCGLCWELGSHILLLPPGCSISSIVPDGVAMIAAERRRQVEDERYDAPHDDCYHHDELIKAAACYALTGVSSAAFNEARMKQFLWPWHEKFDKRHKHDRKKQLTIAGALIAAELDRMVREERRSVE